MDISTKTRYGLRSVVYLGLKYTTEKVSLKEISENENISKRYLEQIFAVLKSGGIVSSVKGTKGGYFLSRKPSEITVGEVIKLLEGNLSVVDESEIKSYGLQDLEYTIINNVWKKVNLAIDDVVSNITIQDIINSYNSSSQIMYYI